MDQILYNTGNSENSETEESDQVNSDDDEPHIKGLCRIIYNSDDSTDMTEKGTGANKESLETLRQQREQKKKMIAEDSELSRQEFLKSFKREKQQDS